MAGEGAAAGQGGVSRVHQVQAAGSVQGKLCAYHSPAQPGTARRPSGSTAQHGTDASAGQLTIASFQSASHRLLEVANPEDSVCWVPG